MNNTPSTKTETATRYIVKCKSCKRAWTFSLLQRQHGGDPSAFCFAQVRAMGGCCANFKRSCKFVSGKFSAVHTCGSKCLSSTGPACECSCGGKNHGAGHAVQVAS